MIYILCEQGTEEVGQVFAGALTRTYSSLASPRIVGERARWDSEPNWDDVLIAIFRNSELIPESQEYIGAYRRSHPVLQPGNAPSQPGGFVLPVSINAGISRPPEPLSPIKAINFDGTPASLEKVTATVGAFLGMAIRPNGHIFISYRSVDGAEIAGDLYHRLKNAGFQPWLDEAPEEDNIPPGEDVQDIIRQNLGSSSLVLLVDTPQAKQSEWVSLEIDLAIAQLIPVLPVVVGDSRIPRFIALQGLRRFVRAVSEGTPGRALEEGEWQEVLREINELLLSAYVRLNRAQFNSQKVFQENGYSWEAIEPRMRMFRARKTNPPRLTTNVLAHCSIHDTSYLSALRAYKNYIDRHDGAFNYRLYIYAEEFPLSNAEYTAIANVLGNDFCDIVMLVHYNELGILIFSNFTKLHERDRPD